MALTKVTGQVINTSTDVTVGVLTVTNTLAVGGTVSIGGTLTYEDVTNIDSVGLITARNGIIVGSGITLSKDGDGFFTGVVTATSYYGDGSNLSNITSTTINSNADNRLITGSGTANTLNGESTLTYDGTNLDLNADSKKLRFGAGQDLEIYHNSGFSYIDAKGDQLRIEADQLRVRSDGGETYLEADVNAGVKLYFDNTLKFGTDSAGVYARGDMMLNYADNYKIKMGAGNDLQIFHDGSHSKLKNSTGFLVLESDSFALNNGAGSENIIKGFNGGAVELYYDNVKALETYSNGIQVGFDQSNPRIMLPDDGILSWGTSDSASIQAADAGSGGYMKFNVANGNRVTINGNGLCFNNDTAAANALDDYEEGTFTPTVVGTGSAGTATYSSQTAKYTKIGDRVFWELFVSWTNGNGSGTSLHIYGLPYTVQSSSNSYPAVTIGYAHNLSLSSNHQLTGLHASGYTYLYFYQIPSGGGSNIPLPYDGSGSMILSGHYKVN